jgi:hypothetical protein
MDAQRCDLAILGFEDLAISGNDQVILHPAADLRVAAFSGYKEVRSPFGAQAQVEIEGKSSGVKRRP